MPGTYLRTGNTNLQSMVSQLVTDLKEAGFTLLNAYQANNVGAPIFGANSAPNHTANTSYYVLAPTKVVDPLAIEAGDTTDPDYNRRQPWRLVIHAFDGMGADETDPNKNRDFIRFWVCTPTQIITELSGEVRVAEYDLNKQSGYLFNDNLFVSNALETATFARKHSAVTTVPWSCFTSALADQEAVPLSYCLSVTDHGVMFSMWAENYDAAGDCFNWFCVQRFVKDDGTILMDEKSPLTCVFSLNGGGTAGGDTIVPTGIQYFTVCEEDIAAPTTLKSAVAVGPDNFPFINPIQQVGVMVNRNYLMHFPKGINTQRYYYPYQLDMIAYASADLLSHKSVQTITLFGQTRQYRALNANSLNNKGMRMVMLVQGSGIN